MMRILPFFVLFFILSIVTSTDLHPSIPQHTPHPSNEYFAYFPVIADDPQISISDIQYQSNIGNVTRVMIEVSNTSTIPVTEVELGLTGYFTDSSDLFHITTSTVFSGTLIGEPNYGEFFVDADLIIQDIFIEGVSYFGGGSYAPVLVSDIVVTGGVTYQTVTAELENNNPFIIYNVIALVFSYIAEDQMIPMTVTAAMASGEKITIQRTLHGSSIGEFPVIVAAQGQRSP